MPHCSGCGILLEAVYHKDKIFDSDGDESGFIAYSICKGCGHRHKREEYNWND